MKDERKRFKNPNPKPKSERAKPRVKAEDKGVEAPAGSRPITKRTGATDTSTQAAKKTTAKKTTAKKAAAKKSN